MALFVSADGLKKAIEHGLEIMDADGTDGFSYPIGTIRGMPARIVVEPETGCIETTVIDTPFNYEAVDDGV